MARRIVLTAREIEAVLAVAGNALAEETFEDPDAPEGEVERMVEAYGTGTRKLWDMLECREKTARRRAVRRPPVRR